MDKAELSQILKEAFRLYGYELAQTFNVPNTLEPLLSGQDAIVAIRLNKNNTITILEYETDETLKEELKACQKTVKEQNAQIEALQAELAESQPQTEEIAEQLVDLPDETPPSEDAIVKPKKRRKRS